MMILSLLLFFLNTIGLFYFEVALGGVAIFELLVILLYILWAALIVIAEESRHPWAWNVSVAYWCINILNLALLLFSTQEIWPFVVLMVVSMVGLIRSVWMLSAGNTSRGSVTPVGILGNQYSGSELNARPHQVQTKLETYETVERYGPDDIFYGTPFTESSVDVVPYDEESSVFFEPQRPTVTRKVRAKPRRKSRAIGG